MIDQDFEEKLEEHLNENGTLVMLVSNKEKRIKCFAKNKRFFKIK